MKKSKKMAKGMSSAVVLSILIHAALFLLAGMLVVFTVVKKEEQKFEPPRAVERPKMKLKKPRVKIKKNSKPKPTTRIVSHVRKAAMPDIQLPEISGMAEGITGGIGGFELMPDLGETTLFGSGQSIGNDLVGTFYDFKRDRNGRDIPHSIDRYLQDVKEFVQNGWKPSELSRYYHSPNNLYATCFMIPPVLSLLAPEAFGEPDTIGYLWLAHYKGQLVYPEDITFRFWGMGDDVLVVAVDGEVALSACWPNWDGADLSQRITPYWQSSSPDSFKYYMGHNKSRVGDWITLEAGVPRDMELIIGEVPGGGFVAMLAVEVQGVEYPKGPQGNPILPMFKTAEPSLDLIETIYSDLVPEEVCITNGPVFCDYDTESLPENLWPPATNPPSEVAATSEFKIRTWVVSAEKKREAVFVAKIGDKVILKDARGKQWKIRWDRLSEKDRLFVELARPPKFNIDFSKQSKQKFFEESPIIPGYVPKEIDYVFSTRLKQVSAGKYNHRLKVEFFAVGEEIDGDNYILFDRQESSFIPAQEENQTFSFGGNTVPVRENTIFTQRRGSKYGGYLVVVIDERGEIIDIGTSHKWLPGILENLRRLPVGRHFDKTGSRVCPPRPEEIGVY